MTIEAYRSQRVLEQTYEEVRKTEAEKEARRRDRYKYRCIIKFVPYTTHSGRKEWVWQKSLDGKNWTDLEKGEQTPDGIIAMKETTDGRNC